MTVFDLYIRNPQDPNYVYGVYQHSDPIESIITKIKVLFNTRQGQVLGDLNFGVGLEDMVFETKLSKTEIEETIKRQISQYITEASEYSINVNVSFGRADGYDYALIDIYIDGTKTLGILLK